MSRKGKIPVTIPQGVELKISKGHVSVKGPKGTLSQDVMEEIELVLEDGQLTLKIPENSELGKFQGLYQALVSNMVKGVTEGFEKRLNLIGVGYRAAVQGTNLNVELGFSHPTLVSIPQGITVVVEKNTTIVIQGADKQAVGQFAANIRALRPPEPYKGKGVHYQGEWVRRKAGKSGKK